MMRFAVEFVTFLVLAVAWTTAETKTANIKPILDLDMVMYKSVYRMGKGLALGDMAGQGWSGKNGKMYGLDTLKSVGDSLLEADENNYKLQHFISMDNMEIGFDELKTEEGEWKDVRIAVGKNRLEKGIFYKIHPDGTCDADDYVKWSAFADASIKDGGKDMTNWINSGFLQEFNEKFNYHKKNLPKESCDKLATPFLTMVA